MSIICTCGNSGKTTGFACNGSLGCPFNSTDGMQAPKIKTWAERLAEEQVKQQELLAKHNTRAPAAKWNPNDREREATIYAGNVVTLLGALIKNVSSGCNYQSIELDYKSAVYHFGKLSEVLGLKVFQHGAVWVKASERLPEKCGKDNSVVVKGMWQGKWPFVTYGFRNYNNECPQMYYELGSKSECYNEVEWLDESGTTYYQQLKESAKDGWDQANQNAIIANKLQLKVEKWEKALQDIAQQKTCEEQEADEYIPIGSDGTRLGDINVGYDTIIEVARKAINWNNDH